MNSKIKKYIGPMCIGIVCCILFIVIFIFVVIPKINNFTNIALSGKITVNFATTENITLSGIQKIDNVQVSSGNTVLVKNQTNNLENGIYDVSENQWNRSSKFPLDASVEGVTVFIQDGDSNKNRQFITTNIPPDNVIGKNPIIFTTTCSKQYQSIGHGLAFEKSKLDSFKYLSTDTTIDDINKQINNIPSGLSFKGLTIRNMLGIMPPAFSFYPFGKQSQEYQSNNDTKERGNQTCKEYCSKTNCIAVQTFVPENCAFKNNCGLSASYGCTLYYDNIPNADEAYYNIYKEIDDPKLSKVGRKYYEKTETPDTTPTYGSSPSNGTVKWCPANVKVTGRYVKAPNASGNCTCTNSTSNCTDINCCKTRDLVTTDSAFANKPMYKLPINYFSYKTGGKILTAKTKDGKCCGNCNGVYISCPGDKYSNSTKNNANWWKLDMNNSYLGVTGDPVVDCKDFDIDKNEITNDDRDIYKNSKGDYDLMAKKSCWFRYNMAGLLDTQMDCNPDNPSHGCQGGPPILSTDNVTVVANDSQYLQACSNIPADDKCQDGKLCTTFPITCDSASGELFIPRTR